MGADVVSRKSVFAKLGKEPQGHVVAEPQSTESSQGDASLQRANRLRMRPILGSPELIPDSSATPVGALGQSLGEFTAKAKRADEIERKLAEGHAVVELDPSLIDPSFIPDRMPSTSEAHAKLVAAIREHGQQVPILVRPHPEVPGRYQVAYGHRRLRALAELGRPVRAVVRSLADEELVIAQGQENNERQDLSFIEKARFARKLEERFRRDTIMTAMSVHKSDLSNMLSVVTRIPEDIINAIGAAPSTGRRGWIELADQFAKRDLSDTVRRTVNSAHVQALDSDKRFKQVLALVRPKAERIRAETWTSASGAKFAKIVQDSEKLAVTIDRRAAPKFAEFLLERLRDMYQEFEASQTDKP